MAGNTIGQIYRVTTFGESHGKGLGVVIGGCPPGMKLDMDLIQYDMDRRKPGQSEVTTPRKELDKVMLLSGVYEGKTTGAPIGMMIMNSGEKSTEYKNIEDKFRPGHADHVFFAKYGIRDPRGGGRSSGRETVSRVMAGAVAKQILDNYEGIKIHASTVNVGGIEAIARDYDYIERNILRCPDPNKYEEMLAMVNEARRRKDSIGGAVEVVARNMPIGLGEPVFDKLNADLMKSLGSIGAVKAVQLGLGAEVETMFGSEYNDKMIAKNGRIKYLSNNAGGIVGGISNGEDLKFRLSVKPTPTRSGVPMVLPTEDFRNEEVIIQGRHDPLIMPRMVPVAEAMMAITLVDHLLRYKAYNSLKK